MHYALLPHRGLVALSGADTVSFLQGLISNDLAKLKPGAAMYAALLSAQGKFLHDFLLAWRGDALLMDTDTRRLPDLLQRLTVYKLRAQVSIETLAGEGVVAVWGGAPNAAPGLCVEDPRLPALGYRLLGDTKAIVEWCRRQGYKEADYDALRIGLGIPDGAEDVVAERSFLLELGFEQLHGVDFNKGCYVGQEVTARSKFRGQVRKHLYQVAAAELPPSGTKVMQGEAEVGELRSHAGSKGLAMLRIDAVEKAQKENAPLMANGVAITASLPAWAAPVAA